jgi:restriction system protein
MSIPDFQSIMLPLLRATRDGREHSLQELLDIVASDFSLSEQERNALLPSGKQGLFYNRLGWAKAYLAKAKLLQATRRSHYRITDRGLTVLNSNRTSINMKFLEQFPEYIEFRDPENKRQKTGTNREPAYKVERPVERTPEETMEVAYREIRDSLAEELLTLVKNSTSAFFERLVVELLVNMGYGGSREEAARAVGKTGDEGIDGIIDEDRLGLDSVYIQAKKWKDDSTVGRPDIQRFVGALAGKGARRGVFITTSSFSAEATNYISAIDTKVVLIDGKRLAEFMIEYNVGVATVTSYLLKRVDSDYFGIG